MQILEDKLGRYEREKETLRAWRSDATYGKEKKDVPRLAAVKGTICMGTRSEKLTQPPNSVIKGEEQHFKLRQEWGPEGASPWTY